MTALSAFDCFPPGEYLDTSATPQNWMIGYTYDVGGNMLTDGINNWTYVYDGENRITTAGGVSYTYDADGRRVQKSSGTNYWYGPSGQRSIYIVTPRMGRSIASMPMATTS